MNLRRPPSGRTISCPFCNRRDFSVGYRPPIVLLKEEGLPPADRERLFTPNPVKWESIRPYRRPSSQPRSAAVQQATLHHRYRQYAGPSFSVRSGSRATTYGGGVLVTYDSQGNQYYVRGRNQQPPQPYHLTNSQDTHWNRYAYRSGYAYPGQYYPPQESLRYHYTLIHQ